VVKPLLRSLRSLAANSYFSAHIFLPKLPPSALRCPSPPAFLSSWIPYKISSLAVLVSFGGQCFLRF
jgi:hypothetical protein